MHREIIDYFQKLKIDYPFLFKNNRVLEAGSLNINGSAREHFDDCEYFGIDAKKGNGVDWWGIFHEWEEEPNATFDVCVSTELLEHDPFWVMSLQHMCRKLKRGGSIILTYAGPARAPHGVNFYQSPNNPNEVRKEYHPWGPEADYYWSPKPEMVLYELLSIISFRKIEYEAFREGQDICLLCMGSYNLMPNYHARGQIALLKKHNRTEISGAEKK